MRLVTFAGPEGPVAAAQVPAGEAPVGNATGAGTGVGAVALARFGYMSVLALVEAGPVAWGDLARRLVGNPAPDEGLAGLPLLAPVPRPPRNVFCIGLNYRAHAEEGGAGRLEAIESAPIVFTKPWTSLVGDRATVTLDPAVTTRPDWEAELAVVIGTGGADIDPAKGAEHVFGVTLANDLSARDLQRAGGPASQWFKGKSLDGFCPLGPALVTVDESGPLDALRLRLELNGEVMQDLHTADMIHDIGRIVAWLSRGMALLPGDVILTGTGAGVGHWREPPVYLRPGDEVVVSAEGLGHLRTSFAGPAHP